MYEMYDLIGCRRVNMSDRRGKSNVSSGEVISSHQDFCKSYGFKLYQNYVSSGEVISSHQDFCKSYGFKLYQNLPFLYTVWKFHKNPIKPRFIAASCNTSLTDVSKWLSNCFKAILPTIHDIWKELLRDADVPTSSSWILYNSLGVVPVIKSLNSSRTIEEKSVPLGLQTFDFTTLYTKLDLNDLKHRISSLVRKVFSFKFTKDRCKALLVEKSALHFDYLWLKSKSVDIDSKKKRYTRIVDETDILLWLEFLLENLYISIGDTLFKQCIGIPMGTNCAVFLANFYLFTYEFEFMERLVLANTFPIIIHKLSNIRRFVDDLFVPDFSSFQDFMYLDNDAFGGGIYPKNFCELNCTSHGDSCAFLDLKIFQSPFGLEVDIYDKRLEPEFASINMIRMPHIDSNISHLAKYGVVCSQLFRFSRLCSSLSSFVIQCCQLISLLVQKGYLFKKVSKKVRTFLLRNKFIYGSSSFHVFKLIISKFNRKGEHYLG
ncbi:hypothetical protein KP509_09G028400 [Ceratopteris richardii]|nr:hypothetical protein KP509_09G028400 [Ceratopteris richardii]